MVSAQVEAVRGPKVTALGLRWMQNLMWTCPNDHIPMPTATDVPGNVTYWLKISSMNLPL